MTSLLLLGCVSSSPLVGEVVTEDGSWALRLAETSYDQGVAEVIVEASDVGSGDPVEGLSVYVRPGMDTMEHLPAVADFVDQGGGTYTATVAFDMSGIWTLTGYAEEGSRAEGFTFVVEVRP